jgi:hypothetical protein
MKRPSYEELETHAKHLEHQNSLLLLFLYDTTGLRAPDAHAASPEGHYGGSLYRCTAADGGYVVIRSFGGEVPTIVYLDEIDAKWPAEIRIMADRLRGQRNKICDEFDSLATS